MDMSGFSDVVYLRDLRLRCRQDLRDYCKDCVNHSDNWVCPPGSGSLEQCQQRVDRFSQGVLLRSVTELTPPTESHIYKQLNLEHNLRLKAYLDRLPYDRLILTSGGCIFCQKCAYPQPCIKPHLKMDSLSAFGIDVTELCKTAKLEYGFSANRVYYVALVLFNN